ncbi:MAG: glutamate synthase large subunit [Lentisphaeria bacterium]|nr:glutamate synthase large subunit [Lentisphaeria bacterium]NQZ68061.1 glutamate synthase large subunit [Lentisphaeria bacterium]
MNNPLYKRKKDIEKHGLYDPLYEHDACGMGAICHIDGEQSHYIIEKALEILFNLEHRGARGSDVETGDGCGILMQLPHCFYKTVFKEEMGLDLPERGKYGVGLVFMPQDEEGQKFVVSEVSKAVVEEGQILLGWRELPIDHDEVGGMAAEMAPHIKMLIVGSAQEIDDEHDFERKLYIIRKISERRIARSETAREMFYVPSLSSTTVVYKGMLLAHKVGKYFKDLCDTRCKTAIALVHQRYSTNTLPKWELAQPFRFLCHNGEINTVRGNANWMNARQYLFDSPHFEDISKIFPVVEEAGSDSAILDNALEILHFTGRSLPDAIMMLIPEAWQNHETMSDEKKAMYEFFSCIMEPWDGPASIPFTDGTVVGALLDRNGLRPSRYTVTKDGFVILASETGVLKMPQNNIKYKGRLEPGRMFLVDTSKGRIITDEEIKHHAAIERNYKQWIDENLLTLDQLPSPQNVPTTDFSSLQTRQRLYGVTLEDIKILIQPQAENGKEPLGSMGSDTPIAPLSDKPQLLYSYFKQLFAQVTNPPLDAIREEMVTSLVTNIGEERDLFHIGEKHAAMLRIDHPVLGNEDLEKIRQSTDERVRAITLPITFDINGAEGSLQQALDDLQKAATIAIEDGNNVLILSDREAGKERAPIPALLATAAVHHHLITTGQRTRCGLILESAEPRVVHEFCVLFGYGICAINPYLAYETIDQLVQENRLSVDYDKAIYNYRKAIAGSVLKIMSKMGISTLHSYRGAQIFECIGLADDVVNTYFKGTASRIGGINLEGISREVKMRYDHAFPVKEIAANLCLSPGGQYQWRRNGEYHQFNPLTIAKLQQACRTNNENIFGEYSELINNQSEQLGTIRGLFKFKDDRQSISIDDVEPWEDIVKRFKSGAMSYGSISKEAHETLAIAMNRIGARSNSGEGGEDEDRYTPDENGDLRSSAIKQVASGRFGVTSHYLINAKELQIKMAQGAKPGEGGQLPPAKVYPWIAKTRHSTPHVGLISPPPHHDIYSIEDLSQLIHDLKNSNIHARVNVKLVSEVGVGTVASGVAKGKADVVLISGYDGGTGATPLNSLRDAGLPWELGLSETHQSLCANNLRDRITVECDGQMKTGRDVVIACLLGAEEFGFATAPLVVTGCIMMRVCHLDTCPVGVATQNPELRKKYNGKPEHVVNFMRFIAEEMRAIMAKLGFRTINEMVGQVDCLEVNEAIKNKHWKSEGLDFSRILAKPDVAEGTQMYKTQEQDHGIQNALDNELIEKVMPALEAGEKVEIKQKIVNTQRTVGTMLSAEISRRFGAKGLPEDSIVVTTRGSAGQSFCAFGASGLTFHIRGDANDYFCKGLSGGKVSVRPSENATFLAEENIIIGNVALYGATAGQIYVRGIGGERFCVRNSGAVAVIEGIGDHGCEYMTGGRAIILGETGRNFAAGMSGGIAYVYDKTGDFVKHNLNMEMVEIDTISAEDATELCESIEKHFEYTDSPVAKKILDNWGESLKTFVKVMPSDYKRALEQKGGSDGTD